MKVYKIMGFCIVFSLGIFQSNLNAQVFTEQLTYKKDKAFYNGELYTGTAIRNNKVHTSYRDTKESIEAKTWVEFQGEYKAGDLQKYTEFYSKKQKKCEADLISGKYIEWHSPFISLNMNAPLKVKGEGMLKQKKRTGKWVFYHKNGKKSAEGVYKNDIKTGNWKYWYANGDLNYEGDIKKVSPKKRKQLEELLKLAPLYLLK
jgi:antitoxin component YwqK of YwqJK toxin-antitoxin module